MDDRNINKIGIEKKLNISKIVDVIFVPPLVCYFNSICGIIALSDTNIAFRYISEIDKIA